MTFVFQNNSWSSLHEIKYPGADLSKSYQGLKFNRLLDLLFLTREGCPQDLIIIPLILSKTLLEIARDALLEKHLSISPNTFSTSIFIHYMGL